MDKQEFLARLEDGLAGLPEEDISERLGFYGEMIDDRMEDGLTEAEAVAGIGPVDAIVSQIIGETPISRLVRERMKPKHRRGAGEIVLLVLGAPLWIPLLIAALAVLFSLYAVVWSVIISLWAVEVSLIASALGVLAAGIVLISRGSVPQGCGLIGGAVLLAGLSIVMFFACRAVTRGTVILTKRMALGIKNMFLRKENTK